MAAAGLPAWAPDDPEPHRPLPWRLARGALHAVAEATADQRVLPGYLVIGAKRAGTTSLALALLEHPQVLTMVPSGRLVPGAGDKKGLRYFDTGHWTRSLRWYRSHFPLRVAVARHRRRHGFAICGDASPYYLHAPGAAERARAALGPVKLIALLREPVARAHSHWKEQRRRGQEPLADFAEAMAREPERLAGAGSRLAHGRDLEHEHHGYATQSRYAAPLQAWTDRFGPANLLTIVSEEFYADPQAQLDRVHAHLGLEPHRYADVAVRNTTERGPDLDPALVAELRAGFAEDRAALTAALERELPW